MCEDFDAEAKLDYTLYVMKTLCCPRAVVADTETLSRGSRCETSW